MAAISKDNVWAVGSEYTNPLVEHWDGKSWQVVNVPDSATLGYFGDYHPIDDRLSAIKAFSATDIYISGSTLLEHWDGKSWHVLKRPVIGASRLSVHSNKDIWVSDDAQGPDANAMAHWDGQQWQFYRLPYGTEQNHYTGGILEMKPNDVWSVGSSDFVGVRDTEYPLIGHWNGQSWRRVNSPIPANNTGALCGMAASSPGDIWVVGETAPQVSKKQRVSFQPLIEHWDGTSWKIVKSGTFSERDS